MVEQPPYPGDEPQPGYPGRSGYPPGYPPYPGYPPPPGYPPYPGYPAEAGPPGGPAWAGGPWPSHSYPPAPGGYWPGYPDPNDPLVTPPGVGINGWFSRIMETVRRTWRVLLPIMAITQGVPALAILVLTLALGAPPVVDPADSSDPTYLVATLSYLAVLLGVVIGATVLLGLLQAVGWAAGTWAVARRAIGEPASVSDALHYGLRRALGLWGWSVLAALIIVAGLCACILPGIYLLLPLSLVGPVFLFERTNPIGRSFRMFHQRLGMMLGRVLLVVAAVLGASGVVAVVQEGLSAALNLGTGLSAPAVLIGIVATVVTLPVYLVQLVGLVVTYAEQRGHEAPVNSAQLAAELDRS